jgi:hypothetical protein
MVVTFFQSVWSCIAGVTGIITLLLRTGIFSDSIRAQQIIETKAALPFFKKRRI